MKASNILSHKLFIVILFFLCFFQFTSGAKQNIPYRQTYKIFVDDLGVMRRSDTKEEVSYYGTNYTAPFAYSYRALGYLGKDRKEAIDNDVYHIARLGLNAYRLHLWDVELADSAGNLLSNDHLDLLDYMIAELEKRGIDIILTAQTNFGNGYPEKDIDTGGYSYDYDKCFVHDNPEAQKIQQNYLNQLVGHVNPYTGRSYAADNAIIAMEINNEPCHSATKEKVTEYINKMAKTIRRSGFRKPVLYNVSHNPQVTSAYYDADIDGTTFQWYPTGLVAGHERRGNLLPAFDEYTIPWKDTMQNYNKLARVVYEFDPADVLYSHLYPAVARTFRKEGFQWITQFAYDPMDLAPYNTEYPTHYLNLAYTPAKALSMMIAAEAAKETPRGACYGSYPENSKFGHTRISYEEDLSEFNSPQKFIYTNDTNSEPVSPQNLVQIAGHGNSPIVKYSGSGAYFLDRVGDTNVWRLEVMPDATLVDDPFGDTDLTDAKAVTTSNSQKIEITIPDINPDFEYRNITDANITDASVRGRATNNAFTVTPGIWLLANNSIDFDGISGKEIVAGNIGLTEYAAPRDEKYAFTLLNAQKSDKNLDINVIPESYKFNVERNQGMWYDPSYYLIQSEPEADSDLILRRYVADKIERIPSQISDSLTTLNIRFLKDESGNIDLPVGSEIAVVTKEGYTYSAPITLSESGDFSVDIDKLSPREGYIIPAPYPTMLTRKSPLGTGNPKGLKDVEFVEVILPQKANTPLNLHLERIWLK